MIKIKTEYNNNFITGLKVSGHANYDEHGKDIVCASVSSMVILSANLALKYNDKSLEIEQSEGLVDIKVLIKDEIINLILTNLKEELEELSKDYKKHVKII